MVNSFNKSKITYFLLKLVFLFFAKNFAALREKNQAIL